ncbi:GTP-binding protein [Bizionia sediminis]|uniref:GTP-binding protein n=1 Tax=Bizionia sediminis TaxID=1737064 RepID=A0ABW5KWX0_9FLAO
MSLQKKDIVLRPRFKRDIQQPNTVVLDLFKAAKQSQNRYIISVIDDHVFLKLPKHKQQFWSPQLHLEIKENGPKAAILHGLFGPNPTVWTMFMFFHFLVASLFIGFGIWAYSNWTLNTNYSLQMGVMAFMVFVWFALYFAGRIGKDSSKTEMQELYYFMETILNKI